MTALRQASKELTDRVIANTTFPEFSSDIAKLGSGETASYPTKVDDGELPSFTYEADWDKQRTPPSGSGWEITTIISGISVPLESTSSQCSSMVIWTSSFPSSVEELLTGTIHPDIPQLKWLSLVEKRYEVYDGLYQGSYSSFEALRVSFFRF